jgi:aspartyl-tRNA(Asn)/glutamyl-tRNA(Gln) amidotransferase subunit C
MALRYNSANMNKKKLSTQDVTHIATLAHLGLTPQEITTYQQQLSSIIDFVGKLNEVDTTNVVPTSQVTGLENVFREDDVKPSLTQEQALANAPQKHNGYFVVKAVME